MAMLSRVSETDSAANRESIGYLTGHREVKEEVRHAVQVQKIRARLGELGGASAVGDRAALRAHEVGGGEGAERGEDG